MGKKKKVRVTPYQLYLVLENIDIAAEKKHSYADFCEEVGAQGTSDLVPEELYNRLIQCHLKSILCGFGMSAEHLGGDDVVEYINAVLAAQEEGYAIRTWYGPNTEALVVGYWPKELEIEEKENS